MLDKVTKLLAMLTIISSGTANADMDIIAYADYGSGELNKEQALTVESKEVVLNKHIYVIQPHASKIEFLVDSPIGEICAGFQDFAGSFTMLNTGVHNGPVSININTESLDTDGGFIGMMLKSESFFNVEKFPSMQFVGSSFEWFNDTQAILKGSMTIKNVTRQVAFYVERINANVENSYSERITMKATANIKRSEFGMHTLLPVVSDDVSLYVSITAVKKNVSISMLH